MKSKYKKINLIISSFLLGFSPILIASSCKTTQSNNQNNNTSTSSKTEDTKNDNGTSTTSKTEDTNKDNNNTKVESSVFDNVKKLSLTNNLFKINKDINEYSLFTLTKDATDSLIVNSSDNNLFVVNFKEANNQISFEHSVVGKIFELNESIKKSDLNDFELIMAHPTQTLKGNAPKNSLIMDLDINNAKNTLFFKLKNIKTNKIDPTIYKQEFSFEKTKLINQQLEKIDVKIKSEFSNKTIYDIDDNSFDFNLPTDVKTKNNFKYEYTTEGDDKVIINTVLYKENEAISKSRKIEINIKKQVITSYYDTALNNSDNRNGLFEFDKNFSIEKLVNNFKKDNLQTQPNTNSEKKYLFLELSDPKNKNDEPGLYTIGTHEKLFKFKDNILRSQLSTFETTVPFPRKNSTDNKRGVYVSIDAHQKLIHLIYKLNNLENKTVSKELEFVFTNNNFSDQNKIDLVAEQSTVEIFKESKDRSFDTLTKEDFYVNFKGTQDKNIEFIKENNTITIKVQLVDKTKNIKSRVVEHTFTFQK
ncbi:hypothetical protein [Mycoplasma crocodyli]|uniref:Putative lipoprotein n=1 Tax=Mycoplasma crocodyli (strain ATCC 51981 / MP145) TaxID=512564 RepID=D5E555_MYCCM|nr:hypothetical protein [Mycoplasma crocodyli]ADE19388.1 putative lipoprotein [Mycoplasma crocodyli MP145]